AAHGPYGVAQLQMALNYDVTQVETHRHPITMRPIRHRLPRTGAPPVTRQPPVVRDYPAPARRRIRCERHDEYGSRGPVRRAYFALFSIRSGIPQELVFPH